MTVKLRKSTDVDLVKELEAINSHGKYTQIINAAKRGDYHDFKSKVATPKMALNNALLPFDELIDLRKRVINGEFDEPFSRR